MESINRVDVELMYEIQTNVWIWRDFRTLHASA